jgi:hypothetical protein
MGVVFDSDELYSIESDAGAIVLIVESDELTPLLRGISTPGRIAGQSWPSDSLFNRDSAPVAPDPIVHFMEEPRP